MLRRSQQAAIITKMAASVPAIKNLVGQNGQALVQHGTEGRLARIAAVKNRLPTMQGPRAYAPRLGKPTP